MTKPAITYAVLAYLITWSVTIGAYSLFREGSLTRDQLNMVYNLGALGPFLAAVVSAAVFYKQAGVRKLFASFDAARLNSKSLLVALSPLGFFVIGWLLYPIFTGHWYSFDDTRKAFNLTDSMSYVGWILPFITYSVFEEFGWRGFLLPHLQERYTALTSTMILTCFWAGWHLPFFLWRFQFTPFITIGFFFSIFVGAIVITSAFNLSRGSIAVTILFHFANNVASALEDRKSVV